MELGADIISLVIAFVGGVLSFLSPCVLPVIPVYLSLISGLSYEEMHGEESPAPSDVDAESTTPARKPSRWRLLSGALAFVAGFGIVTVLVFSSLVKVAHFGAKPSWVIAIQWVAAVVMVLFALQMFGLFRIAALSRERRFHLAENRLGLWGALLIGAAFALGWMPCTGPILAGIISLAMKSAGAAFPLALAYVLGMALPFLLAALFVNAFLGSMRKVTRHMRIIEVASGVLLLIMAVILVTGKETVISGLTSGTKWADIVTHIEEWFKNLMHR